MVKNTGLSGFFRQIPFMVVMLAAFVFSASNSLQPLLYEEAAQKGHQLEQEHSDENRPVAYLDYSCDAIAPAAHLLFFQATYKILLPALQLKQEKPILIPSPRGSDSFFRILFRLIISPNAP